MNPDWIPSFGRKGKHKNIIYSMGYSGHGVAAANYSGKLISDLYFERDSSLKEFFFQDYKTKWHWEWFMHINPIRWLGFKGYIAYMELADSRAIKSLESAADRNYYLRERFERSL